MQIPRIYQNMTLDVNNDVLLDKNASHHLLKVLRLKEGFKIKLFNGDNHEYSAVIKSIQKNIANVTIQNKEYINKESNLNIHLGQGISKGDKMDYTIQKAIELGVNQITPLLTSRTSVKLTLDKQIKKIDHWQKIAIAACEQSGRNKIPKINSIMSIKNWGKEMTGINIALDPKSKANINNLNLNQESTEKNINLAIGPEGGLEEFELELLATQKFQNVSLGPRILRTETASVVALSCLGIIAGDL